MGNKEELCRIRTNDLGVPESDVPSLVLLGFVVSKILNEEGEDFKRKRYFRFICVSRELLLSK